MDTTAKYTAATLNRPEGDRIIDAPFVFTDLEKYIGQLKREDAWSKNDRNGITIYKTTGLTVVLTCLHKDASIVNNSLDSLLTIHVLEGTVEFSMEQKALDLQKNQLISLHHDVLHTIRAKEDAAVLLIKAETITGNESVL